MILERNIFDTFHFSLEEIDFALPKQRSCLFVGKDFL